MDRKGNYALITCLPPLVGGRGTTKWWRGAAEGGLIKLAAKPPPPPSEPGPRSGPSSCPLPSRCARHPPPGRGWAGNMEERNVASNPAYPILWGEKGDHDLQTCLSHLWGRGTTPFKLASHRSSGGGGPRSGGRGPPIGGQDRDGASYRCSAPYTLSRFAGLPLKGKRENMWHWILCHI